MSKWEIVTSNMSLKSLCKSIDIDNFILTNIFYYIIYILIAYILLINNLL